MKKRLIVLVLLAVIVIPVLLAIKQNGLGGEGKKKAALPKGGDKIGIIYVEGPIVGGRSGDGIFGQSVAAGDDLMEQLREAREDDSIKAVILRINSPGGSAAASQEVGEEIDRLREAGKVIVTSMGDVAASGGYWLAAKTDYIVANPATMTGSIGVIMRFQELKGLYDKLGITDNTIKSGPLKDIGSEARPMTPAEKALLQGMVNDIYEQFVDVVAEGRKLPREKVKALADGRIFTGRQAKAAGLVDELGNFYTAVEKTRELAHLEKDAGLVELGKPSPWRKIFGSTETVGLSGPLRLSPAEEAALKKLLSGIKGGE